MTIRDDSHATSRAAADRAQPGRAPTDAIRVTGPMLAELDARARRLRSEAAWSGVAALWRAVSRLGARRPVDARDTAEVIALPAAAAAAAPRRPDWARALSDAA